MTHAQVEAAAQRYTHGWIPIDQSGAGKQSAPAKKTAPPSAPKKPAMTAAERQAARDAKKADTAAKRQAVRVAAIRSKLKGAQSRAQARAAVSGQKLEDLQVIAADLKLSTKGDQATLVARLVNHFMPSLLAAAAYANTPGKVFADPGYQSDGKKRYPLDSADECRAAWSYINQPDNAAKYTPSQLKRIRSRILAAGRKYGIHFAEGVQAAAAPMLGVELARPGTWQLSTGKMTFDAQHLKDAADFYAASGQGKIPLGFGHQDPRFDGDPAFGWVSNIRYAEDDKGPVLLGDLVDMDEWVADAAPKRWPHRSIEGFKNLEMGGRNYTLALTRLALLGSTPPAMPTLRSLADVRQAVTQAPDVSEAVAAAVADSGAEFIAASLSPVDTQDPAAEAVVTPREEKEAGMDPAKVRERLGLDDDVSDDEVMEALEYAGFITQKQGEPAGETTPVAAAAGFVAPPGTMLVEASAMAERDERIRRLEAEQQRHRDGERDQIITDAIRDGKFPPARREHWVRLWNADAEGTRQVIATLARNMVPVAASGYSAADSDEEFDAEFAHLFPPTARKGA